MGLYSKQHLGCLKKFYGRLSRLNHSSLDCDVQILGEVCTTIAEQPQQFLVRVGRHQFDSRVPDTLRFVRERELQSGPQSGKAETRKREPDVSLRRRVASLARRQQDGYRFLAPQWLFDVAATKRRPRQHSKIYNPS